MSSQPTLIFVTGPAGAGKSTVSVTWASQRPLAAVIDQDILRRFVKGGFADPAFEWNDNTRYQWGLARSFAIQMARRYLAEGFECVIDAPCTPSFPGISYDEWEREFDGLEVLGPVVLLPELDAVQRRVAGREGPKLLPPDVAAEIYGRCEGWRSDPRALIIDNTDHSVDDTVAALRALVDRHVPAGRAR